MRLGKGVAFGFVVAATVWLSAQTAISRPKVEFQGHGFKVVRTRLEPHQKTDLHSDPGRFEIVLSDADLRSYGPDGSVKEIHLKKGAAAWSEPLTHRAENIGSTAFEEISIIPDEPARKK